jgi:hypothetical protein
VKKDIERLFKCEDGPVGAFVRIGDEKVVYQTMLYTAADEDDAVGMFLDDLKKLRDTVRGRKKPTLYWRSLPEWVGRRLRARLAIPGANFTVVDVRQEEKPSPYSDLSRIDIRLLKTEVSNAIVALERINGYLDRY